MIDFLDLEVRLEQMVARHGPTQTSDMALPDQCLHNVYAMFANKVRLEQMVARHGPT